jgi:hypothetical protein
MTQTISSLEDKIKAAAHKEAEGEWLNTARLSAANAIQCLAKFFSTDGTILEAGSKGILPGAIQIPDPNGLIFQSFALEEALQDSVSVNVFALLSEMQAAFISRRAAELTEVKTKAILASAK